MEFKLSTTLKKVLLASAASLLVLSTGLSTTSILANAKHRRYHYRTYRVYRHHRRTRTRRIRRHARHTKHGVYHGRASWKHGKLYYTTYTKHTNRHTHKHAKHTKATHKTYARQTHRIRKAHHYTGNSVTRHHMNYVIPAGYANMSTSHQQSNQATNCLDDTINLINQDRENHGLNDLTLYDQLDNIAAERAQQAAGNFNHYDSNGNLYADEDGYNLGYNNSPSDDIYGENLSQDGAPGANIDNGVTIDYSGNTAAKDMNNSMMYHDQDSDDGHRANILNPNYTKLGVGTYYTNGNDGRTPGYTMAEEFAY